MSIKAGADLFPERPVSADVLREHAYGCSSRWGVSRARRHDSGDLGVSSQTTLNPQVTERVRNVVASWNTAISRQFSRQSRTVASHKTDCGMCPVGSAATRRASIRSWRGPGIAGDEMATSPQGPRHFIARLHRGCRFCRHASWRSVDSRCGRGLGELASADGCGDASDEVELEHRSGEAGGSGGCATSGDTEAEPRDRGGRALVLLPRTACVRVYGRTLQESTWREGPLDEGQGTADALRVYLKHRGTVAGACSRRACAIVPRFVRSGIGDLIRQSSSSARNERWQLE